MAKIPSIRTVSVRKFEEGADLEIAFGASKKTVHAINILISGSIQLTTAGTAATPGSIYALLDTLQIVCGGVDPSVMRDLNSQVRMNLRGVFFGWTGRTTPAEVEGGCPRINLASPHMITLPDTGVLNDIDITSLTKQDFAFVIQVPITLIGGVSPRDTVINTAYMHEAKLKLRLGRIEDLALKGTTVPVGAITDATVEVELHEFESSDPLPVRGNADNPDAYLQFSYQNWSIDADNAAWKEPLRISGLLNHLAAVGLDNDNKPTDKIIKRMTIQRENQNIIDRKAILIRDANVKAYRGMDASPNAQVSGTDFLNSGVHILCPAQTPDNLLQISNMPFLGNSDGTSFMVNEIERPDDENGELIIIFAEVIPGAGWRAANYPLRDQTAGDKANSQESRAAIIAQVTRQRDAARSINPTSVS